MTNPRRFEADLAATVAELYLTGTPQYRDDILRVTARTPQRPAWSFPERWLPMQITMQLAPLARLPLRRLALAGLALLLLAAMIIAYAGSQRHLPTPFGLARNGAIPVSRSGDLYLADPGTGQMRLVLGGATDDHSAGFSPDGTLIGFIRGNSDLWVMDADGANARSVTGGPVMNMTIATWTPDSRHLAVAGIFGGQQQLELFDVRGTEPPKALATDYVPDILTFRPPTGNEWLFRASKRSHPDSMGLFVMNSDGTNIRTLIQPTVPASITMDMNWPDYSPDGRVIYYTHYADSSRIQLWAMNADGTGRHQFTHVDGISWEGEGSPSPDGRYVAFWQGGLDSGGGGRIGIARSDGTVAVPVVSNVTFPNTTAAFVWSPDSTRLLVVAHSDGTTQPYLVDPETGAATQLSFTIDPDDPDWQRLAP